MTMQVPQAIGPNARVLLKRIDSAHLPEDTKRHVAEGLELGATYGDFDDERDMPQNGAEEARDGLIYVERSVVQWEDRLQVALRRLREAQSNDQRHAAGEHVRNVTEALGHLRAMRAAFGDAHQAYLRFRRAQRRADG